MTIRACSFLAAIAVSSPGPAIADDEDDDDDRSNFQVELDGVWRGICTDGDTPTVSDEGCRWSESGRILTDETSDVELDCPEGGPTECDCDGSGERLHGWDGADVMRSLGSRDGGPVYPDHSQATCVVVDSDGRLRTAWTDDTSCPRFRLE